jgi:hypothetical protein
VSFNVVHHVSKQFGPETLTLRVYVDKSATFAIFEGDSAQSMRSIDPDENGPDIAICGEAREWFDQELAAGRHDWNGR